VSLKLTSQHRSLIIGLTVGTLITSAIVTGAAAPSAHAKPLFKSDHSWEDILGESKSMLCPGLGYMLMTVASGQMGREDAAYATGPLDRR
jgi:hypothetical protein